MVAVKFLTGHGERAVNVLVAVLLVASLAGPFVATAAAVPSGMVTIPDANVSEDVPVGSNPPINLSRLEGNVMASAHAETLRVIVTTPDRADDYLENGSVAGSSGSLTLVLKDDTHSEGRRVAIGAGAVRDALGYTPKRVYGTHEDGTKWSRAVEYEAGMLVFEVPHFSSNSITFSGEVSITGTYTDGSTVNYDINSLDAVSNLTINVTGQTATEWDNETTGENVLDSSTSVSIAGTEAPSGPSANGNPTLEVSSPAPVSTSGGSITGSGSWHKGVGKTSNGFLKTQIQFDATQDTIHGLTFDFDYKSADAGTGTVVDVYIVEEGVDSTYGEGTLVKSGWNVANQTGNQTVWFGSPYSPASSTITVELVTTQVGTTGAEWYLEKSGSSGSNTKLQSIQGTDGTTESSSSTYGVAWQAGGASSVSVSTDDGVSKSIGTVAGGSSTTVEFDVSRSATTMNVTGSGVANATLRLQERTETEDPTVEVNGNPTSYSGTLADGTTAKLSANSSWIESGTNTINVSVGDGTLSADAPTPSVRLDYNHSATDKQSVSYEAGKWRESYNVSKTFASDRSSASLTIPFSGEVVGISTIEKRVNGGTWSTVSQDAYSLNDTTLTVDLGSVNGGDTVEVRTTGRRVVVVNGDITVVEPTVKGERLDTKVRLDSWSTDSHISVGSTPDARRVHYVYKESWSNADPYSKITADGYNFIYMPAASAGAEARVSTIPVSVNPTSGEVRLSVDEPRTQEPQFQVRPGAQDGDTVEFTYVDAADDTHYVLKSKTNDVVRDDGTANSPLTLTDDDSSETLVFLKDAVSSDSGSVGPTGGPIGDGGDPLSSPTVVVIAWGILTAGFYVLQRRVGGPSGLRIPFVGAVPFPGGLITAVGSAGSGLLIVEFYSGRVSKALAGVIESVGPIAGIAAVGIVVWWAYNQFRGRPVVIQN